MFMFLKNVLNAYSVLIRTYISETLIRKLNLEVRLGSKMERALGVDVAAR